MADKDMIEHARKEIRDLNTIHNKDAYHHMKGYVEATEKNLVSDGVDPDLSLLNDSAKANDFAMAIVNYHAGNASKRMGSKLDIDSDDLRIKRYSRAAVEKDLGTDVDSYRAQVIQAGANYTGFAHTGQHQQFQQQENQRAVQAHASTLDTSNLDDLLEKTNAPNILEEEGLGKLDKNKLGRQGAQLLGQLYFGGASRDQYRNNLSQYTVKK
jgi:hypothetical protein